MRLLVKVLPLGQGPPSSLFHAARSIAKQFSLPVKAGQTFADIWPIIESRFKSTYPLEGRDFIIQKLQDIYGSDIVLEDVVDLFFEDETDQQKKMVHVVQAPIDRDMSVAIGSGLRPLNAAKRAISPTILESNKRRRLEQAHYGYAVEDMQPDRPIQSLERERESATRRTGSALYSQRGHQENGSELALVEDSQREIMHRADEHLQVVTKSESPGQDDQSLMDASESLAEGRSSLQENTGQEPGIQTDDGFRIPGLPASSLRRNGSKRRSLSQQQVDHELHNVHAPLPPQPQQESVATTPEIQVVRLSPSREVRSEVQLAIERTRRTPSHSSSTPPSAQRPRDSPQGGETQPNTQSSNISSSIIPMTAQKSLQLLHERRRIRAKPVPLSQKQDHQMIAPSPSEALHTPNRVAISPVVAIEGTPSSSIAHSSSEQQAEKEDLKEIALQKLKELTDGKPYKSGELKKWTMKEDEILLSARAASMSYEEIGRTWLPDRGRSSCRKRAYRLRQDDDSHVDSSQLDIIAEHKSMSSQTDEKEHLERLNEKHMKKEAEKEASRKRQEACIQRQIKAKKFRDKEKELGEMFRRKEAHDAQAKKSELKLRQAEQDELRRSREVLERSQSSERRSSQGTISKTSRDPASGLSGRSKLSRPRDKGRLKTYGRSTPKSKTVDDPFSFPSDNDSRDIIPRTSSKRLSDGPSVQHEIERSQQPVVEESDAEDSVVELSDQPPTEQPSQSLLNQPQFEAGRDNIPKMHRSSQRLKGLQAEVQTHSVSDLSVLGRDEPDGGAASLTASLRRSVSFNNELDISNRYAQPHEPSHGAESPRSILKKARENKEHLNGEDAAPTARLSDSDHVAKPQLDGTVGERESSAAETGNAQYEEFAKSKTLRQPKEPGSYKRFGRSEGQPERSEEPVQAQNPTQPEKSWSFAHLDGHEAPVEADEVPADANVNVNVINNAEVELGTPTGSGSASDESSSDTPSSPSDINRNAPVLPSEELGESINESTNDSQKTGARYLSTSPSTRSGSESASDAGTPPASSPPAIRQRTKKELISESDSESEREEEEAVRSSSTPLPPSPSPAPLQRPLRSAMKGARRASQSAASNTTTSTSASTSNITANTTPKPIVPKLPSTTPGPLPRARLKAATPRLSSRSGLPSLSDLKGLPPPEIPKPVYTGPPPKTKASANDTSGSDSSSSDSDSSSSSENEGGNAPEEKKPKKNRFSGLIDLANANNFPM